MYIDTISIAENKSANIADLENLNINLYPNPSIKTLTIDGYTNVHSNMKVINSLGKVVINTNFKNSLDVSALESGIYYLKIIENNHVFIKNFTKI